MTLTAESTETEATYYPVDTPITLETYNRGTWRKLTVDGRRARTNPIASRAGWPERFDGDWQAFATFPTPLQPWRTLRARRMGLVSRWNSACLNRWLIRYNFGPKLEWPDETP
jgi:hypothetical protein